MAGSATAERTLPPATCPAPSPNSSRRPSRCNDARLRHLRAIASVVPPDASSAGRRSCRATISTTLFISPGVLSSSSQSAPAASASAPLPATSPPPRPASRLSLARQRHASECHPACPQRCDVVVFHRIRTPGQPVVVPPPCGRRTSPARADRVSSSACPAAGNWCRQAPAPPHSRLWRPLRCVRKFSATRSARRMEASSPRHP
jgi:hypothetical protein